MIGEQFDHGDEICGAVVNVRAKDKISIWTKNAANETAQVIAFKQINLPVFITLSFYFFCPLYAMFQMTCNRIE